MSIISREYSACDQINDQARTNKQSNIHEMKSPFKMSCGAEIGVGFVGVGGAGAVLATVSSGVVGVIGGVMAMLAVADATAI